MYRKSVYSGSTNCVEVDMDTPDGSVRVRDSKNPGGTVLIYERGQWEIIVGDIKSGVAVNDCIEDNGGSSVTFHEVGREGAKLVFTRDEFDAFKKGCQAGEFDK